MWDIVDCYRLIREDLQTHDNKPFSAGFQALAVHRLGNWRMTIKTKALRLPVSLSYKVLERSVRAIHGVELPYSVKVGRRVRIDHGIGLIVHGSSEIGDGCCLRHGVTLGNKGLTDRLGAPKLGPNVDVCAGAKIIGRVTIGPTTVIGANAVVTRDVPAGSIVVGANKVKLRSTKELNQTYQRIYEERRILYKGRKPL